ncbi:hypothetical protein XENTR_v10011369 [Xenopus tropicalis]|nr:hypothetical protein XENTR_v10011369 [Xenopus tropicalis]
MYLIPGSRTPAMKGTTTIFSLAPSCLLLEFTHGICSVLPVIVPWKEDTRQPGTRWRWPTQQKSSTLGWCPF